MLRRFLQRLRSSSIARDLYREIVARARQPEFYARLGVPDTVEGRFDMIVLHLVVVLRRLRREGRQGAKLAQGLIDTFFADMDHSLREMGVSDIAVPKRMKQMIQAFYGRAAAYEAALQRDDVAALSLALERNVTGTGSDRALTGALAGYVADSERMMETRPLERIAAGDLAWAILPAPAPEGSEV